MTAKKLLFRSEAREHILAGATTLTDAIRVTLGPKSKSVLIQKRYGSPIVCNDGVTIARELELEDPVENLGAEMLREAAQRTGDAVGDGTSTSTILAHAIYSLGLRNVVAGASSTFCPSRLTPSTTSSEIAVDLRSSRTLTTVPSRISRTMSSPARSRLFQLSQSALIFLQTRDTVDFEIAPRNSAASARPTRRVLVPAR